MLIPRSAAVYFAEDIYEQYTDADETQMGNCMTTAVNRMEADFKVDNEAGNRMLVDQVVSLAFVENKIEVAPRGFVMLLDTGRIPLFEGENTSSFGTKHCAFAYFDEYGQLQFNQLPRELSEYFINNTEQSHNIQPVKVPKYPTFAFVALPKSHFRGKNLVKFNYWDQSGTAEKQYMADRGYWGDSVRAVMGLGVVNGIEIRTCAEKLVGASQLQTPTFNENLRVYS